MINTYTVLVDPKRVQSERKVWIFLCCNLTAPGDNTPLKMLDIASKMAAEVKVKRCKVRHGSGHSTNLMLRELFMHCLKA
jgi:hypothetical protein